MCVCIKNVHFAKKNKNFARVEYDIEHNVSIYFARANRLRNLAELLFLELGMTRTGKEL